MMMMLLLLMLLYWCLYCSWLDDAMVVLANVFVYVFDLFVPVVVGSLLFHLDNTEVVSEMDLVEPPKEVGVDGPWRWARFVVRRDLVEAKGLITYTYLNIDIKAILAKILCLTLFYAFNAH